MAGSASPIQELRTSLEKSRWQLHDGLIRLESGLGLEGEAAPPTRDLPEAQEGRMMLAALIAGLAAGLFWFRSKR